ncbi:DUF4173 domain-containing protein [candidate division WWE3 bacterium]|uniref:DUF4173 domain-containing protein n=1 Tax=candidate division WWE3 bacterium TaxID=2053526 RepID=A0A928TRI5_UNCKA|nr:DUF4173 domain-containing protein [candidate division WWE3 bacterium]
METQPHPHHRAHIAVGILCTALASAAVFQYFFYDQQYGVALALFLLFVLAGIHVLTALAGGRGNAWAYFFLVPFGMSIAATVLYSSEPVRLLSLLISVFSLAFFAFWFSVPRTDFLAVKSLWPFSFFLESFIPFPRLGAFGRELVRNRGHMSKMFVGAGIAIPFLLLFGMLFISADGVIRQMFTDLFAEQSLFWRVVNRSAWTIISFLFFASAGYALTSRITEHRSPKFGHDPEPLDAVVVNTFLVLLNFLFLGFIAVQFFMLFGGEKFLQAENVTYAQYARQGFFQLLAVSALVFGIVSVLYRFTGLWHWLTRILAGAFILQTGVIIASAIRRLLLYVDIYGLTLSRYWAFIAMILLALALIATFVAMLANAPHYRFFNILLLSSMFLLSATLLFNAEAHIARVNTERFLSDPTQHFDALYLGARLSSDAVPVLADAFARIEIASNIPSDVAEVFRGSLKVKRQELRGTTVQDWKRATISDYQALASLERLFAGE